MAMSWLGACYGELRQGYRLLLSACDFLAVLESGASVPDFWQNVLVTWGMFDAPVPLVEGAAMPTSGRSNPPWTCSRRSPRLTSPSP